VGFIDCLDCLGELVTARGLAHDALTAHIPDYLGFIVCLGESHIARGLAHRDEPNGPLYTISENTKEKCCAL
jgi:hypothetical protein